MHPSASSTFWLSLPEVQPAVGRHSGHGYLILENLTKLKPLPTGSPRILIFGDHAQDAEGLAAYGRLMRDPIITHGPPTNVLGPAQGDPLTDDTPSLLRQVWPELGETQGVTPAQWDELLEL